MGNHTWQATSQGVRQRATGSDPAAHRQRLVSRRAEYSSPAQTHAANNSGADNMKHDLKRVVLIKAADYIEKHGLWKGSNRRGKQVCALTAIGLVAGDDDYAQWSAIIALEKHVGTK